MLVASSLSDESISINPDIPKCKSIAFSISCSKAIAGSIENPVISLAASIGSESKGSEMAIFNVFSRRKRGSIF